MTENRANLPGDGRYLLLVDEAAKQFTVVGPLQDATYLRAYIARETSRGRRLRVDVAPGNDVVAIARIARATGCEYTSLPLVLT
jgi:hypothetical protein